MVTRRVGIPASSCRAAACRSKEAESRPEARLEAVVTVVARAVATVAAAVATVAVAADAVAAFTVAVATAAAAEWEPT